MPYIKQEARAKLYDDYNPETAGELNYNITLECQKYHLEKGSSYETFNSIIGALECAKQEFYRRVIVPYEDKKIKENGDVY